MKNTVKSRKGDGDADASSSFSRLPDEIILQILNKLTELKTLCFCYLLSRRFSSIVLQVDAISFSAPFLTRRIPDKNTVGDDTPSRPLRPVKSSYFGESFLSVTTFLSKFKEMKSLRIELPFSSHKAIDNGYLFKWKAYKLGNRVESFIFLSPYSISAKDENGNGDDEEDNVLTVDVFKQKVDISLQCLKDVIAWHMVMLLFACHLPMLEEVSITDSGGRGRLSLSGRKLAEMKEWVQLPWETVMNHVDVPYPVSNCYIPVLKLPVSGYVMKGIYVALMEMEDLEGVNDGFMNSEDGFEDKEEAAYTEAVMEILQKHKGMLVTMPTVI